MEIKYNLQELPSGKWKLYSFTTENIASYITNFNFENKSVLCVAGSGDHIINSILLGAKNINAFDINQGALFFSELKLVLLENLLFEEYLDFFMIDGKNPLNYEIYKKHKNKLSNSAVCYFDNLYEQYNFNGKDLRNSEVFNNQYDTRQNKERYNLYLNQNDFYKAKENCKTAKITFVEGNLKTLKFNRSYDIILLSNISDYILDFGENYLQKYFNIILSLKTLNNTLVFGYVYDVECLEKRSDIDHKEKREKCFCTSKYVYTEHEFDSAINGKKDRILILKGEK